MEWGPCWPVRQFFEMLKNQYRQLNFMALNNYQVFDIWTDKTGLGEAIPEDFIGTMQAIYRKHGWPEISRYQKEECLAEVKRVLDERYPGHHNYYFR